MIFATLMMTASAYPVVLDDGGSSGGGSTAQCNQAIATADAIQEEVEELERLQSEICYIRLPMLSNPIYHQSTLCKIAEANLQSARDRLDEAERLAFIMCIKVD